MEGKEKEKKSKLVLKNSKMLEMKNKKTTRVFLYTHEIWQILKHFSRALS